MKTVMKDALLPRILRQHGWREQRTEERWTKWKSAYFKIADVSGYDVSDATLATSLLLASLIQNDRRERIEEFYEVNIMITSYTVIFLHQPSVSTDSSIQKSSYTDP